MKMHVFQMDIIDQEEDFYYLKISNHQNHSVIKFSPKRKELQFIDADSLSGYLKENEYQLRKLLHNKRPYSYYTGFSLRFALRDKKDVALFNDHSRIVAVDKRNGKYKIFVTDKPKERVVHVYTDGCYLADHHKGAYAVLIKKNNLFNLFTGSAKGNSNRVELIAAIEGLKKCTNEKELRIVTDSRYVKKGLTEWIINWRLNDWHTANGKKVKHISDWKIFDKLSSNKYVEFEWVKGHSDHPENKICDFYAKQAATRINPTW